MKDNAPGIPVQEKTKTEHIKEKVIMIKHIRVDYVLFSILRMESNCTWVSEACKTTWSESVFNV